MPSVILGQLLFTNGNVELLASMHQARCGVWCAVLGERISLHFAMGKNTALVSPLILDRVGILLRRK